MTKDEIKPGTPVTYWRIIDENYRLHDPFDTVITSNVWTCCDSVICKVKGVSGGVDIEHLTKR